MLPLLLSIPIMVVAVAIATVPVVLAGLSESRPGVPVVLAGLSESRLRETKWPDANVDARPIPLPNPAAPTPTRTLPEMPRAA